MSELVSEQQRALVNRRAGKAASEIHAAGLASEIAERVKDPHALEQAILRKLDAQRDFAAQYRELFPHGFGPGRGKRDDSSGISFEPSAAEWCLGFGFHIRTVQRWCELLDPAKYSAKHRAVIKRCWQLTELWQSANFSSASVEWYTPAKYLDGVREVLGEIDLDPASSEEANKTVRARKIFDDRGLELNWFGRVFLNPPYGVEKIEIDGVQRRVSLASAFCYRAIDQYERRNIDACIMLVNSLHSQTWQRPLYDFPICFVDHRIQFVSGDGEANENPTFQNIFVYLGTDEIKFASVFTRFGYVMRRIVP